MIWFKVTLTNFHRYYHHSSGNVAVEAIISNICCEVPSPPPGCWRVIYHEHDDHGITIGRPPLNKHTRLSLWNNTRLSLLFKLLSVQNIMTLMLLILTERKILLVSSTNSRLTAVAEAILSLIFPFGFVCPYAPFLPRYLLRE